MPSVEPSTAGRTGTCSKAELRDGKHLKFQKNIVTHRLAQEIKMDYIPGIDTNP